MLGPAIALVHTTNRIDRCDRVALPNRQILYAASYSRPIQESPQPEARDRVFSFADGFVDLVETAL